MAQASHGRRSEDRAEGPSFHNPGGFPLPFTNIRMWQPVSPGVMELWNWVLEYSFMPEEYAQEAYLAAQFGFGSGGIFEQDDTAVWEGPGDYYPTIYGEYLQEAFWRQWLVNMRAGA